MPTTAGRPGTPPGNQFASDEELATHAADSTSVHGIADTSALVAGETGREYAMFACVIRNTGSPDYFQALDDSGHQPTYIDSVVTDEETIQVHYESASAVKTSSVIVVPDETFTAAGFVCGSSVGLDDTRITVYRNVPEFADYVYFDGAAWVSQNGIFTAAFDTGILTLTHATLGTSVVPALSVSATSRGGVYVAQVEVVTTTTLQVKFRGWDGTLATTANTDMQVYVRHGGNQARQATDPRTLDDTAYPFSNFWILGVMETA